MTTTQTNMWIALPNGFAGDAPDRRLRLSVFVAPRLRTDAGVTLAAFPDWVDWAALSPELAVEVDDGTVAAATIVSPPPDPALWRALFDGATPLRPFAFDDYADRAVVSYPVRGVVDFVKRVYRDAALASPTELPRITRADGNDETLTLDRLLGEVISGHRELGHDAGEAALSARLDDLLQRAREEAGRRRAAGLRGGDLIEPPSIATPGGPADSLYRSMLFHYRPAQAEPVELPADDDAKVRFTAEFDFHQMLSALGDYPALLRQLGLAFDLELAADALPISDDEMNSRKLRVRVTRPSAFGAAPADPAAVDVAPWTVYARTTVNGYDLFVPWPTRDAGAGMWSPIPGAVDVVQVDPDGAALKTLHQAHGIARRTDGRPQAIDAPERDGLAALRTSGLAIVQSGRAGAMVEDFNRSLRLNELLEADPPAPDDLRAEDVQRGYRLDVLDGATGRWHSLHQRIATFSAAQFPAGPFELADEGIAQPVVTTPAERPGVPPDPTAELYVHEALFTWDGWSLSAPRPGMALSRSPRAPAPDEPETAPQVVENTAMTAMQLSVAMRAAPASLPRLRFGRNYRLRVRAVDLAGNSPTVEEATAMLAALGEAFDPVLPEDDDVIYRRFEPVGPPVVVPRAPFNEGESVERIVIRADFDRDAEAYTAVLNEWAAANGHEPYRSADDRHCVAPKAALAQIEAHGLLDAAFDASGPDAAAVRAEVYQLAVREGGALADRHGEEQLVTPYLPDPWSAGVVFQGLPGVPPEQLTTIGWGGAAWQEATPFRLVVAEGNAAPAWDDAARTLTVFINRADVVTVRVSSMFGGELTHTGLFGWLAEAASDGEIDGADVDRVGEIAKQGRHWMFTPWRELILVHATQHPLAQPQFLDLGAARDSGGTVAYLAGLVDLHAGSTSKLDVLASWSEPRDDPAAPAPITVTGDAHVMEVPLDLQNQAIEVAHYETPGRYVVRLEDQRTLQFDVEGAVQTEQWLRNQLAAAPPPPPAEADRLERRRLLAAKLTAHDFGDTKHRRVRYRVAATSRFREYLPPHLWDDLARTSDEVTLDLPATARPAPPLVTQVLPTFGWSASDAGGVTTSRRHGAGVRIYLERGWWSSGEGELLAVVLGQYLPDRANPLYRYSTFWAQDALGVSPQLELPLAGAFRDAALVETRVELAELPGRLVTVVGFEPQWDGDRGQWTVDLELPTSGHYFPFVRLALARFQPRALSDLRLSSVALADVVQTAPDRVLTLARDGGGPGLHRVQVSGASYSARRAVAGAVLATTTEVTARIERRDPAIADDALAWSALPGVADTVLTPGQLGGVPQQWQGDVAVAVEAAGATLRLVVREHERYDSGGRRLVYADTVAL